MQICLWFFLGGGGGVVFCLVFHRLPLTPCQKLPVECILPFASLEWEATPGLTRVASRGLLRAESGHDSPVVPSTWSQRVNMQEDPQAFLLIAPTKYRLSSLLPPPPLFPGTSLSIKSVRSLESKTYHVKSHHHLLLLNGGPGREEKGILSPSPPVLERWLLA